MSLPPHAPRCSYADVLDTTRTSLWLTFGVLVVALLVAGVVPSHGQEANDGEAAPRVESASFAGPASADPVVVRAWAHDDFGRLVFDWPRAVEHEARIEEHTLTVMFEHPLKTTFWRVERYLDAYIADVALSPDGRRVTASLTGDHRLRTFTISSEEGVTKVVVDLLADGGASPSTPLVLSGAPEGRSRRADSVLAQAPAPPTPEPSPEAPPRDASPHSSISGGSPLSPTSETAADLSPPRRGAAQQRGGLSPAEAVSSPTDTATEVPKTDPPRPTATPPRRGEDQPLTAVAEETGVAATPAQGGAGLKPAPTASEDTPPAESSSAAEDMASAERPPAEPTAEDIAVREPAEASPLPESEGEGRAAPSPAPDLSPTEELLSSPLPPEEDGQEPGEGPGEGADSLPAGSEALDDDTLTADETGPVDEPTPADMPAAEPTPETPATDRPAREPAEAGPLPEGEGEGTPRAAAAEDTAAAEAQTPDPSADPSPPRRGAAQQRGGSSPTEAVPPPTDTATEVPGPDPPQPAATPPRRGTADEERAALFSIPVSQSRLFRLDAPVASVVVANPEIADVQLVSSGALFVLGKAVGRTSVAALDADSDLIAEWTIATVIDVEPVRAALGEVDAFADVAVRQLNRGVELSGTVASVADADLALRLTTTALPEAIPVENRIRVSGAQQINLEVQIAEVQRSVSETLGINWEVVPNLDGASLAGFRVGRLFFDPALGGFLSQDLQGGRATAAFGGGTAGRTTVRGLIDALATAGLATVLARPNVTAISGETASFFSGGEYPLPAGFEDGAIIFEYKKYGVLLDFVPTIVDSGRIVLTVRPEVSERSETDSLTVTGIDIPVINVRRAETTVEVGDGESIVIAGLYRDQSEAVEAGVPVLKDIPLLNLLFGTRTVRSNATELIVVVTARLTAAAVGSGPANRQVPGRRLRGYHY